MSPEWLISFHPRKVSTHDFPNHAKVNRRHNHSHPTVTGNSATPQLPRSARGFPNSFSERLLRVSFRRPSEIFLTHREALVSDQITKFKRNVLDFLREPLEDGQVTVSRICQMVIFPAQFTLVASINPCPCGYFGDPMYNPVGSLSVKLFLPMYPGSHRGVVTTTRYGVLLWYHSESIFGRTWCHAQLPPPRWVWSCLPSKNVSHHDRIVASKKRGRGRVVCSTNPN
eukprot:scaffold1131_cov161-Amphora_coffeaeformis.AAC.3